MHVLKLDVTGVPHGFISPTEAATDYSLGNVAWTVGDPLCVLRGGTNSTTGSQSLMEVHPIIAVRGHSRVNLHDVTPSLTNRKLFARDRGTCCWCGDVFGHDHLTREHIVPTSRGGLDTWMNVASACRGCNSSKGAKLVGEIGWKLLYVPYVPSLYEDLLLQGRKIRQDVHEWLASRLPKGSRLN